MKKLELAGRRFGRLYVLNGVGSGKGGRSLWHCMCDCGSFWTVTGRNLTSGVTRSCGCLRREAAAEKGRKFCTIHGKTNTDEHRIWRGMIERCSNPNHRLWGHYGGRGITVCERWNTFVNFLKDMGLRPSSGHTIERTNNNKGYQPGNCVWATRKQQAQNRRPRQKGKKNERIR